MISVTQIVTKDTYQIVVFRTVLLQQRVAGEIGSVATGSEDDSAVLLELRRVSEPKLPQSQSNGLCLHVGRQLTHVLAILFVLDTHDLLTLLKHLRNLRLLQNLHAVRSVLGQVLKLYNRFSLAFATDVQPD